MCFVALDRFAPTYCTKYASARRFIARLAPGTFFGDLRTKYLIILFGVSIL